MYDKKIILQNLSSLTLLKWSTGARLNKAYDVTIQRCRNSHPKTEDSKKNFEISHKILNPYTAKYAFYEVLKIWRLMIF